MLWAGGFRARNVSESSTPVCESPRLAWNWRKAFCVSGPTIPSWGTTKPSAVRARWALSTSDCVSGAPGLVTAVPPKTVEPLVIDVPPRLVLPLEIEVPPFTPGKLVTPFPLAGPGAAPAMPPIDAPASRFGSERGAVAGDTLEGGEVRFGSPLITPGVPAPVPAVFPIPVRTSLGADAVPDPGTEEGAPAAAAEPEGVACPEAACANRHPTKIHGSAFIKDPFHLVPDLWCNLSAAARWMGRLAARLPW